MKKLLAILLSAVMLLGACFALTACGDTDGSELQGFDIDLAKAVCEELGVEARFQKITWDAKVNELNSQSIDLIWNGMTITDALKSETSISLPYMKNKQVAVVKAENVTKYADAAAIKAENARLAAESGSAGAAVIKETFASQTSVLTDSQASSLTEIMAGTSDVAIIDSVMAGYYTSTGDYKDKLVVVPDLIFSEEEYGIAARKEDTGVTDKINTALAALYKNGSVKTIAEKYGLENELVGAETFDSYTSTGDTAGWDYISGRGKIVIGYTLFAPIAFKK